MDYACFTHLPTTLATYDTVCKDHIAKQTQSTTAIADGEQIEHMWAHVNAMTLERATGAHQQQTLDRVGQLGMLSSFYHYVANMYLP